jgi:putative flippase GtrA
MRIRITKERVRRFMGFALVGLTGFVVNNSILWATKEILHLSLFVGSPIAIIIAIMNNYTWNYLFTWRHNISNRKFGFRQGLWRYYLVSSIAASINYFILMGLVYLGDVYYLTANISGILAGMMINFVFSEKWVFAGGLQKSK